MALNIVSPETVTVKELAEEMVGRYPTDVSYGPPRPGDVPPALVSAERAAEVLDWRAEMPFSRGLDELISSVVAD